MYLQCTYLESTG